MPKPLSKTEGYKQELRYRERILYLLIAIIVIFGVAYLRFPNQITVYQPPDPSRAQVVRSEYVPPTAVYSFASLLMDRLMRCENDCEIDSQKALDTNRAFLTEKCYSDLSLHRERNIQLYRNRTRELSAMDQNVFKGDKVRQLTEREWVITDDYKLKTFMRGVVVIDKKIRYSMRVLKTNMSIELNPYQLQFDCFGEETQRIEKEMNQ